MQDRVQFRVDYDRKDSSGQWIPYWSCLSDLGVRLGTHSLSSQRWGSINRRVKNTAGYPTYVGVLNKFTDFQEFAEWSQSQVGYSTKETCGKVWSLDKDIKGSGGIYSPEDCIFVPQAVNKFLTLRNLDRGAYALGVYFVEGRKEKNYRAQVNMGAETNRKSKFFSSEEEAHRFWQENKIIRGRELAAEYKGWHHDLYSGLTLWLDKVQDDYENYRITDD